MPKRKAPKGDLEDEHEIELTIDETALQACERCGFRVQQWPSLLPVVGLRGDCLAIHATYPEENFYLTWRAAEKLLAATERPALLGYVAELLEFYLDGHEDSMVERRRCGAEFWVQRRGVGHGIDFLWDKDEALRDACDVLIHPAVSTVTYLTAGGAPTVLLEVRASACDGELASGAELVVGHRRKPVEPNGAARLTTTVVSYPRTGKLLAFSGALLHGVPSALAEVSTGSERLTLLVNVWVHHKPLGLGPLPQSFQKSLTAMTRERVLSSSADHVSKVAAAAAASPLRRLVAPALQELSLDVCGNDHVLRILLPAARRVDSSDKGVAISPPRHCLIPEAVPYIGCSRESELSEKQSFPNREFIFRVQSPTYEPFFEQY